jgi:hypothetical protein
MNWSQYTSFLLTQQLASLTNKVMDLGVELQAQWVHAIQCVSNSDFYDSQIQVSCS